MDMLQQTALTKYHHQVHLQGTGIPILTQDIMIDLHLTIITGTDITLLFVINYQNQSLFLALAYKGNSQYHIPGTKKKTVTFKKKANF